MNPAVMSPPDLEAYLGELRGECFVYRPNPGNAGDALIATATLDLFRRLRLSFEIAGAARPDLRGRVVIHGGGGGFWRDNAVVTDFLHAHAPSAKRLILLPQTILGNATFLRTLGPHVDVFCRERVSFEYLKGLDLRARTFLADDLALHLPVRSWLERHGFLRLWLAAPGRCLKGWRRNRAGLKTQPPADGLQAWRGDLESACPNVPGSRPGFDPSRAFALGMRREGFIHASTAFFLRYIDHYHELTTDRLHVAIAGCLLGKTVRFHPNRYFKNRAVYEHSLRGRFPSLGWEEGPGGRPR